MLQFWLNLLILVYIAKGSEIGGVRFCPGARPSPSLARYLCLSATFLILPIAQTSNTSDICYVTSTATLVLHSQADLDALSPCTIFTGDIAINGDIGVNTPTPTESALALPTGLTTILGRLDISSLPNLVQLNASHLENITTGISMQNLNNLKAVFLQNLRASGIYFELVQLPALAQLGIGNFSLPVDGASFGIYGTQLPAMRNVSCNNVAFCEVGIHFKRCRFLSRLEANQYITSISQPGLMNASFITILYNSPDLSLNLPDLLTSGHTSFGNMDGVNIKVLQNTSDHLTFGNASLTNISAPELISVGRDLEIGNCIDLTTLYFPKLQTISRNFLIEGNPSLEMISGFPSLTTIGGDLDWTGAFNNASSLPQLKSIGGALNVQSSSRELRCPFPQLRTNGVIHGHGFVCTGGVTDPDSIINGINVTADNLTPAANNTNGTSGDL